MKVATSENSGSESDSRTFQLREGRRGEGKGEGRARGSRVSLGTGSKAQATADVRFLPGESEQPLQGGCWETDPMGLQVMG